MKEFIAWVLLGIAGVGALYALGLVIYLAILPDEDIFADYPCGCKECEK